MTCKKLIWNWHPLTTDDTALSSQKQWISESTEGRETLQRPLFKLVLAEQKDRLNGKLLPIQL